MRCAIVVIFMILDFGNVNAQNIFGEYIVPRASSSQSSVNFCDYEITVRTAFDPSPSGIIAVVNVNYETIDQNGQPLTNQKILSGGQMMDDQFLFESTFLVQPGSEAIGTFLVEAGGTHFIKLNGDVLATKEDIRTSYEIFCEPIAGGGSSGGDDCVLVCEGPGSGGGVIGKNVVTSENRAMCDWDSYIECLYACPLVIDLAGDGFLFGGPENTVPFDLLSSGDSQKLHWVSPGGNDAFLAIDLNGNGLVDQGNELFGNGTLIIENGSYAINGFVALLQYDRNHLGGNHDGFISPEDDVWNSLYLWLDGNADGVCSIGEMTPVYESDLVRLGLFPLETARRDEFGNWMRFWSDVERVDSGGVLVREPYLDVYFRRVYRP